MEGARGGEGEGEGRVGRRRKMERADGAEMETPGRRWVEEARGWVRK